MWPLYLEPSIGRRALLKGYAKHTHERKFVCFLMPGVLCLFEAIARVQVHFNQGGQGKRKSSISLLIG